MKNKNCSRYLRDLKHLMPIYGKKQRKYLYTLKQSIDDFCISTPTPTYEDLINHFGTPQEIIGDYIRELDTKILLKQINRNYYLQIILRILFISAFVCCILYGINCYRAYLHCIQSEPVYMYEEISTDNVINK